MHDTAYQIGGLIMDIYLPLSPAKILEIGAQNVNGSLRDHAPRNAEYVGLDFEAGDGVDIVVTGTGDWNVPDAHFDLVMASSVFEHDKAFWQTFVAMCRKAKPGGHIYVSAPSNGTVHRYPKDYWRFYPDSGMALEQWARSEGFDLTLVESFVAEREAEVWNDFCAVFRLGPSDADLNRDFVHDKVRSTNVLTWRSSRIINPKDDTEDMRLLGQAREETRKWVAHSEFLNATLSERETMWETERANLKAEEAQLRTAHSAEIEQRSNQIRELEQQIEQHRSSLADAAATAQELDVSRRRGEELAAELERLNNQAQVDAEQREEQIRAFRDKLSELQSRLAQREEEAAQAWTSAEGHERERDMLAAEVEKVRRDLVDANGWVMRLALTRTEMERRITGLEGDLAKLSKDFGRVQQRNILLESRVASLSAQTARPALSDQTVAPPRSDSTDEEIRRLQDDLAQATNTLVSKELRINQHVKELVMLGNMLASEQDRLLEFEKQNAWLRETGKVILDYRRWWWRFIPSSWQRKRRDRHLLKKGLFDAEAYVNKYPDVITSGQDPLRHYFYHGVAENRQYF
ncbi:methyltransferase domain-containing protein [Sphingobium xenophagum]